MADGAKVGGVKVDAPHLPQPALIDAYGNGGFRFGGRAWPVNNVTELTAAALELVFSRAEALDVFLIGAGRDPWPIPERLRARFRTLSVSADAMATGAAVRTYNILLAENRRVGAGLIAVD